MNASRFLNLAAILSLDLESQFKEMVISYGKLTYGMTMRFWF